jgi:endonuclease/exonuclease/phosphatase family metal-dependent hydrolase
MTTSLNTPRLGHQVRVALIVPLVALLGLVSPAATAKPTPQPELTVMTRNLYLGSSLAPAVDAETLPQLIGAVAQIYGTAVFTDFPSRAAALAEEVAQTKPDLIGLQEVSNWIVQPVGNPAANAPSFDFLTILTDALKSKGLDYSAVGVSENALIGPLPLVAPAAGCVDPAGPPPDCVVTFADRDVILANNATRGLSVGQSQSDQYTTQEILNTPGGPLSFARGWVSIDARYQGKSFRFVNTHLETEDYAPVQQAQAAEFISGPARGRQTIAVGDFNSAADGSTTNSYAQLTSPRAFTDAWTVNPGHEGLTCCQAADLTNVASQVGSRIDLILTRGPIRPLTAEVVGDTPFRAQTLPPRPIWASDHAGVVARVRIR